MIINYLVNLILKLILPINYSCILNFKYKNIIKYIVLISILFFPIYINAAQIPLFNITNNGNKSEYAADVQILLIMTALGFIPALLIALTSFTRIIIVFAILRQALGLGQTPSNIILLGLSLILTAFIMNPVFNKITNDALNPYLEDKLEFKQALNIAEVPLKEFMLKQIRQNDLDLFLKLANKKPYNNIVDTPIIILAPAFITSELKTALQIGFIIFIPFLIIDLIVSSILMAMGMMMLSPLVISLPFKIMLFVLVDGWALLIGTLAKSFGTF